MKELLQQIEIMRLRLKMSKRELAIRADISEEYYWKVVTGKAPGISYEIIEKLANSVGLKSLWYLDSGILDQFKAI